MEFLKIILLCIFAAICYGIVHDQITARVCVEYFTVGHPPVFNTNSPTLLGLGWGVIATWWVGLILGVPLAFVARVGSRPKLTARQLAPPVLKLLGVMALWALAAGIGGYVLGSRGTIRLPEDFAAAIPAGHRVPFIADWFAHLASYAVGFIGGIVVIVLCGLRRRKLAVKLFKSVQLARDDCACFTLRMALPYTISTLLYCFNERDEVLLMERAQEPNLGLWSPCGGKLHTESGESPHACACREAWEEMDVKISAADLHLTGIIAEQGYQGQSHWLMFLFEVKRKLIEVPAPHREGRFQFFSRAELASLKLPQTDAEQIWPLFWQHRGGFFAANCHCHADGRNEWTLEESRPL